MGLLLSSFRRKKTTFQVLEDLEKKICSIEQYGHNTEQRRRRVVGMLMVFSVGLYGLSMILFYFYFRPSNIKDILIYATPLLVFPLLVVFIRAMLTHYYEWKLKRNKATLIDMRAQKKKILEQVMDKETYKYAKEILDKFGEVKEFQSTPSKSLVPQLAPFNNAAGTPRQRLSTPIVNKRAPQNFSSAITPHKPIGFEQYAITNAQLPRPVLTSGGPFDRLVDYLVGDGPGSRYALICSKCTGHNGMALPEEFEYLSYKCAYCNFPNPARKQKPKAPPLMSTPVHVRSSSPLPSITAPQTPETNNDSEEEKNSEKDSDDDAVPTPLKPKEDSIKESSVQDDDKKTD